MIRSALALAARGFHIFPCRPRDKRPATANGLKDATTDPDIIQAWWQQQPDNNIAIATGPASGIFVVDVDGLDAEAALRRLEAEHGALPATVEVITARGRHIYFKWPQEPVRNSAGKIGPHIDVTGRRRLRDRARRASIPAAAAIAGASTARTASPTRPAGCWPSRKASPSARRCPRNGAR